MLLVFGRSADIWPDISAAILVDISAEISADISADTPADISADISADVSADISGDISPDMMLPNKQNNLRYRPHPLKAHCVFLGLQMSSRGRPLPPCVFPHNTLEEPLRLLP